MKKIRLKILGLILMGILVSGCSSGTNPTTFVACSSTQEWEGMEKIITLECDGDKVVGIVMEINVDTTIPDMGNIEMVQTALRTEAPFYNDSKDGLEYEFYSVGPIVTEKMMVDLTTIARPVLLKLRIIEEEAIDGDDSSYTVNKDKYIQYLEEAEMFKASCEMVEKEKAE